MVSAMALKTDALKVEVADLKALNASAEERIARLERDAEYDEAQLSLLEDIDHIRRQMRLVAVERAEALRMRLFLDRAKTRLPRPLIAL